MVLSLWSSSHQLGAFRRAADCQGKHKAGKEIYQKRKRIDVQVEQVVATLNLDPIHHRQRWSSTAEGCWEDTAPSPRYS